MEVLTLETEACARRLGLRPLIESRGAAISRPGDSQSWVPAASTDSSTVGNLVDQMASHLHQHLDLSPRRQVQLPTVSHGSATNARNAAPILETSACANRSLYEPLAFSPSSTNP